MSNHSTLVMIVDVDIKKWRKTNKKNNLKSEKQAIFKEKVSNKRDWFVVGEVNQIQIEMATIKNERKMVL